MPQEQRRQGPQGPQGHGHAPASAEMDFPVSAEVRIMPDGRAYLLVPVAIVYEKASGSGTASGSGSGTASGSGSGTASAS